MKIFATVIRKGLLLLICFAPSLTFAQADSFTVTDATDSVQGCFKRLSVLVYSNGLPEETAVTMNVSWGDGANTTETYDMSASVYEFYPTHAYPAAGNYVATVHVMSETSGGPVGPDQTISWIAPEPGNCGFAFADVFQLSVSVSYPEAVLDFTGSDGVVQTVTGTYLNTFNVYENLNMLNLPVDVSVNEQWLESNNLIQTGDNFTIVGFNPDGSFIIPSFYPVASLMVECGAVSETDVSIYGYSNAFIAPLETGNVWVNAVNLGCGDTTNATVSISFEAGLEPVTANLLNPVVSDNTLTFDVESLSGGSAFYIPFTFDGSTPAGTVLEFYCSISNAEETNFSNNTFTFYTTVQNSYDPNSKEVNLPAEIDVNAHETLNYTINFQNEGNLAAFNVMLRDTISALLDLSSFKLMHSKHPVSYSIDHDTREIVFTFSSIDLAPQSESEEDSKGSVIYSIRENEGLALNSEIRNTAYIYFDFNPAIITNTTLNKNVEPILGTNDLISNDIEMFPNPASNSVCFVGNDNITEVMITDLTGKEVYSVKILNDTVELYGIQNGMYNVILTTASGNLVKKLVVEK